MPWPQQSPAVTCSLSAVHRWEKNCRKKNANQEAVPDLVGSAWRSPCCASILPASGSKIPTFQATAASHWRTWACGNHDILYNIIIFIWKKQLKARPCWSQFFKTRHFLLLSVWWGSTACIQLITWEAFWCTESVKTLRLSFNSSRLSKGTAPTFPGAGASSAGTVEEGATSINSIWARSSGILALRCTTVCWKTIATIIQKTTKKTLSQLGFFILLPCLFFAMWFLHPFLHLAFLHSYNVWRLYEKFGHWLVIFIFPVSSSMVDLQQSCKGKQSKNN